MDRAFVYLRQGPHGRGRGRDAEQALMAGSKEVHVFENGIRKIYRPGENYLLELAVSGIT